MIQNTQDQQEDIFEHKTYYDQTEYFHTKSKNLISKKCFIKSSDNIQIFDHVILMRKLILRGDLSKIYIGRFSILCEGVIVKPPHRIHNNQMRYVPIEIGSCVFIDEDTIVQAMKIGNNVKIGKQCIINPRTVVGQNSIILDNSIVTADSHIASNSVYGGKPAIYLGQLPQSANIVHKDMCVNFFDNFRKIKKKQDSKDQFLKKSVQKNDQRKGKLIQRTKKPRDK